MPIAGQFAIHLAVGILEDSIHLNVKCTVNQRPPPGSDVQKDPERNALGISIPGGIKVEPRFGAEHLND